MELLRKKDIVNIEKIKFLQKKIQVHVKMISGLSQEIYALNKMVGNVKQYHHTNANSFVQSIVDMINSNGLWHGRDELTIDLLKSKSRLADVVAVRDSIIYSLKNFFGMSYASAGNVFLRDHSTAIHACKKIEQQVYLQGINGNHNDLALNYLNYIKKHIDLN